MDCSPPGSPIHGILQARVLGWGASAFSDNSYRHSYSKREEMEETKGNFIRFSQGLGHPWLTFLSLRLFFLSHSSFFLMVSACLKLGSLINLFPAGRIWGVQQPSFISLFLPVQAGSISAGITFFKDSCVSSVCHRDSHH